jgi:hypothetical protein
LLSIVASHVPAAALSVILGSFNFLAEFAAVLVRFLRTTFTRSVLTNVLYYFRCHKRPPMLIS